MKVQVFNKDKVNIITISVIIIAVLLIISPSVLRLLLGNNTIPGRRVYYDFIVIKKMNTETLTPYHSLLFIIWNYPKIRSLFPIILGLINIILLYYLAKQIFKEEETVIMAVLIAVLSPTLLYLSTVIQQGSINLFFFLLLLLLIYKKEHFFFFTLLILSSTLGFTTALMNLVLLVCVTPEIIPDKETIKKNKIKIIVYTITLLLLITLLVLNHNLYWFELAQNNNIGVRSEVTNTLIAELWSKNTLTPPIGISVLVLIGGFIGVFAIELKNKERNKKLTILKRIYYVLIPLIIILLITNFMSIHNLLPYILVLSVIPTAYIITWLIKREWSLPLLKNTTIVIITIEILLIGLSGVLNIAKAEPTITKLNVINCLGNNTRVLTMPEYGLWIEYFTNNTVVCDDFCGRIKGNELIEVLKTMNFSRTIDYLKREGVNTILITPEMKKLLKGEDRGILYLINNNKLFERKNCSLNTKDYEVWLVKWDLKEGMKDAVGE